MEIHKNDYKNIENIKIHNWKRLFKFKNKTEINATWLKSIHTYSIIPNYNIKKDIRVNKRGGGVSLYIHGSLQYKL